MVLLLLLACIFGSPLLPITGTFLDIAYDGRLKYANVAAHSFSCAQWADKISEFYTFGVEVIVFQAVHDARWGAYYNSKLPFMKSWNGTCVDVIEAVMARADTHAMKVFLTCEFVHDETDSVVNSTIMNGRLAIMSELAQGHAQHPSFEGWYFSSEAYIAPYFPASFITYVGILAAKARSVTPQATLFVSPYGTRYAINDDKFVSQLKQLDVDVIAYQDEVGCIRDELPVATSAKAFATLQAAHALAAGPKLWANIESFTWEDLPNNSTSALIPAAFPRIASQLDAVARAGVERVITFTVEAMYEAPDSAQPWGPPAARRLYDAYQGLFVLRDPEALLLRDAISGHVSHDGVGHKLAVEQSPVAPFSRGHLLDGLTGNQDPYDNSWLGFQGNFTAVVDMGKAVLLNALAVYFLQVSPAWYVGGNGLKPVERNVTAYLPHSVVFDVRRSLVEEWRTIQTSHPKWWEREVYDIRAECFTAQVSGEWRYVRVSAVNARPPWAPKSTENPLLLLSEIIVNPTVTG